MRPALIGVLVVTITGAISAAAFAHEGKLPEDALTLVLRAALASRKPDGVHLDQVKAALAALERKDMTTARRLLVESIMPVGMPMPAQGRGPQPSVVVPPPARPASPPPSVEVAMKITEPL